MSDEEIDFNLLSLLNISRETLLETDDRKQIRLLTEWYNQLDMEIYELNQMKQTEEINKSRDYKMELKKSIEAKIKSINKI